MRVEELVATLEARSGHGLGSFAPDAATVAHLRALGTTVE
jgi:hypothetical protein